MQQSDRYKQGWQKLKEIDGDVGEKVITSLENISPDLGKLIIEFSFGDIYTRDGLDLKSKEIAVVAALTATGNAEPQLRVHLNGALNTGSTVNELKEVILQMSVYAGFPRCINAMHALKDVLRERQQHNIKDEVGISLVHDSIEDRLTLGEKVLSELDSTMLEKLKSSFDSLSPDLVRFTLEYGYADIFSRRNLDKKYRQIATIAALTAMGNATPQLKFHINGGLNIGLKVETVREVMLLMIVYAGFPAAINGTNALKEVLAEREPK